MLVHKTNMHPFRPEGLPVWLLKNHVYFIKFKKWYFSKFWQKTCMVTGLLLGRVTCLTGNVGTLVSTWESSKNLRLKLPMWPMLDLPSLLGRVERARWTWVDPCWPMFLQHAQNFSKKNWGLHSIEQGEIKTYASFQAYLDYDIWFQFRRKKKPKTLQMSNMGRTGQVPCWPCCDKPMLLVSEVLEAS